MDVINGRSTALTGAIAVAFLSGALACQSARADSYAFGNTEYSSDYATLTLQEGSQSVTLSTNGFQGWISQSCCNDAGSAYQASHMAGVYGGSSHDNFFVFKNAGVNSPVTSAKLKLYAGAITAELDYSLYGATDAISQLAGGIRPDASLYAELGQGVKYGSFVIDSGNSMQHLMFALNAAAVSDINAAIRGRKTAIAISGAAIAVPEPSAWIMMLAGFAGLGLAAYRRVARGQAAPTVG
jgi:hypothetical protein